MKVVTANRLRDGVAVYFTGDAWSEFIADARVGSTPQGINELLERARADERTNRVVAPYLIELEIDPASGDDRLRPKNKKERVRAVGPSVRPDLNRAAGA